MTRTQKAVLVVVLITAAALRLTGLDWDDYQHHHPDERYISWVATTIELPSIFKTDWTAQLRPEESTFNPFHWPPGASSEGIVVLQNEPRDFAYGHVPLYLGVLATRMAERVSPMLLPLFPSDWSLVADVLNGAGRIEFHHITAVGRVLTALFDVGTVGLIFLIGRRLYSPAAGLLAAAFLAVAVLHIQMSHFFTSDPYMTFFIVAALYSMMAAYQSHMAASSRPMMWLILAGATFGLAVGSKFSAILIVLPLLWTSWSVSKDGRRAITLLFPLGVGLAVFAVTNPFAVLDWTCSPLEPASGALGAVSDYLARSCYLQNVITQNAMVRGHLDLGFTRQYSGTWPYLYFVEMLLRWGLGFVLGVVGFIGLAWAVWHTLQSMRGSQSGREWFIRLQKQPVAIVLLWVLPYFLLTGSFYVKFIRYMQPIVPFLLLFGAAWLIQLRSPAGRRALVTFSLAAGTIYALIFVALYAKEHPWNAASKWIYTNVPPGSLILSEQLDDYLPVTMTVDGRQRTRGEYPNAELAWLSSPDTRDDEGKLMDNLSLMATADYLTVLSNRIYGVVPRLPGRFPLSAQYHQLLFDGSLGYELVWVGERTPRLFGRSLRADTFGWPALEPPVGVTEFFTQHPGFVLGRADESFIVYDQPLTMIFRNTGGLTAEEMLAAFEMPAQGN